MADDDWVSISEAARRLGVTRTAIRNRIKRGTLPTKAHGNCGWLVQVAERPHGTVPEPLPEAFHDTGLRAELEKLREDNAVLRERASRYEGAEAELRARLADRDRERDWLVEELTTERQHSRELNNRLDQLHERHRTELEAPRAELAFERRRPWWRWVR